MNYQQARRAMVDGQIRTADVTDHRLLAALYDLPRERFVPSAWRDVAYSDSPIALERGGADTGRVILRPMVFAKMAQAAAVGPEDVVLDIGCGLGYSSAVFARLAAFVVALEDDDALARAATENLAAVDATNVAVVTAPLEQGYPDSAPYDAIVIHGGVEFIPPALMAQLKSDGRIVAISGAGLAAKAMVYQRTSGALSGRAVFDAPAGVLPGFSRPAEFVL